MAGTPNINDSMVRTLGEWGQFFDKSGKPNDIIELMDQDNSVLDDIKFMEANGFDGHTTTIRNGLPEVYWRRLYKGIPPSKSRVSQVKDACGMLEARSEIDLKMLELHASQSKAYRASEAKAFMEAMRQKLATTIIYGSIDNNPDGFHGLDPRYAHKNAPQVIDAGGTTADKCTSLFGVVWGENEVHGIFPRDSQAGLKHKPLPEQDAYDADGNAYRAVGDLFEWNVGLTVRDWRCVVRICNIDTTKLTLSRGETGFVDLHRLTIQAKNMIPPEKRSRMIWYANQDVMTALELQASDAGYVHLNYGDLFRSKNVPFLHGCGVRQLDAILSTENPLAAMP